MFNKSLSIAIAAGVLTVLVAGCVSQQPTQIRASTNSGDPLMAADPLGAAIFPDKPTQTQTASIDTGDLGI